MTSTNGNMGIGGNIPPSQREPTLIDQERALQKGKGTMLVGAVIIIIAIVGGIFFLLSEDDEKYVYSEWGKKINGMKIKYFDMFWGCVLKGEDIRELKSNQVLVAQIDKRASFGGTVFVQHLRNNCMDKLEEFHSKLDVMIAPEALQAHLKSLKESISSLRSAFSAYMSYLDDSGSEYESDIARPKIQEIARSWYEFKKAHVAMNKALKEKIE